MWLFCAIYLMPCISMPAENIPARVAAFHPAHFTPCRLKSDVHTEEGSDAGIPYSLAGPFVVQMYEHTFLASCTVTAASRDGAQHLPAHICNPDTPAACASTIFDAPYWSRPAQTDTLGAGKCAIRVTCGSAVMSHKGESDSPSPEDSDWKDEVVDDSGGKMRNLRVLERKRGVG